jgi:hypothetical protein
MKAETRKELETNTLADKMGQAMEKVKGGSPRAILVYILVFFALLVVLWLGYRWYVTTQDENSRQWMMVYDGAAKHIHDVAKEKSSNAAKAARFQIAWEHYWEGGIKNLGFRPEATIEYLRTTRELYKALAEDCKDDPVFEPQAKLGLAVIAETLAIQDPQELDRAKKLYEELEEKHGKSAEADFARERLKHLKDKKFAETRQVYEDLRRMFRVPVLNQPDPLGPLPELKAPKGEK